MAQKLTTIIGDVIVAFQQNPGADNDSIIDAGNAEIEYIQDNEVIHEDIYSVGGGYYGLSMNVDESKALGIFGMTYNVHRRAQDAVEEAARNKIISWDDIWTTGNHKIQHCLQLLGYYRGEIDGILARQTEEALLAFQADNEIPTRGLEWLRQDANGDDTAPNVEAVNTILNAVNNSNRISWRENYAVYLIRKSLLRFTRAPTDDADGEYGPAVLGAPDVDDRGFVEAETIGLRCKGPVTSYSFDPAKNAINDFRVKVIRDGIADDAALKAESENQNYVEIVGDGNLLNGRNVILKMRAKDPGRKSRKVEIYIKWLKPDTSLITIATLRIIVLKIKRELLVRPYMLAIGTSANSAGADYAAAGDNLKPHLNREVLDNAFVRVNCIWRPYGIKFRFLETSSQHKKCIDLTNAGTVTYGIPDLNEDSMILQLGNEQDRINLFIVKQIAKIDPGPNNAVIQGPYGAARSPIVSPRLSGIILQCRTEGQGWDRTGDTLAHELGHWLALAHNNERDARNRRTHVEDDPDEKVANRKKDIWTIRRLMLGTRPDRLTNHGWAHHTGYDNPVDLPHINGKMLSLRNLPEDRTDNECRIARERTRHRKLYHD